MLPLSLLASDEIEHDGIKVRERERTIRAIPCRIVIFRHYDRQSIADARRQNSCGNHRADIRWSGHVFEAN